MNQDTLPGFHRLSMKYDTLPGYHRRLTEGQKPGHRTAAKPTTAKPGRFQNDYKALSS
jgi:hypothetical protein